MAPTFAALAGAKLPEGKILDGRSFAPQLKGKRGRPREAIFCYFNPRPLKMPRLETRFAMDVRWKLYGDGRLFDLDPSLREMFPEDMTEQRKKLMMSIKIAVAGLSVIDKIVPALQSLGRRHLTYDVEEVHYEIVGQALIWTLERGLDEALPAPHRFGSSDPGHSPRLELDLAGGEIRSVIWATGYRPDYSWLHVPVLDRKGRLRHNGGIVDAPGLYAMGLPFMRRRKSTLVDGAADDANDLADHLVGQFRRRAA